MTARNSIDDIYSFLSNNDNQKEAIKCRIIKIVLSNSVIRVFKSGSKSKLSKCLSKVDLSQLKNIKSQDEFDNWHFSNCNKVYLCLKEEPENLEKLGNEGLKWGHSAKIFNLFIGHLITMSAYFTAEETRELKFFLHVPLDSKVFNHLKLCGVKNVPDKIKEVTSKTYKTIQQTLRNSASKYTIAPVYFDDYAWALD